MIDVWQALNMATTDEDLIQVVFQCTRSADADDSDVLAYLSEWECHSRRQGFTGVIFHIGDGFVSVAEGQSAPLIARLEDVAVDRRRRNMVIHREMPVASRRFDGWKSVSVGSFAPPDFGAGDVTQLALGISRGLDNL